MVFNTPEAALVIYPQSTSAAFERPTPSAEYAGTPRERTMDVACKAVRDKWGKKKGKRTPYLAIFSLQKYCHP